MPKKKKKTLTLKQKKLAKLIMENLSSKGLTKSMTQIMKEAGYAPSTAHAQQADILDSINEEISPIVNKMITERDAAIAAMSEKRDKAKYKDLTDAIDKFTKNIQLLTGGKTENNNLTISWEK